ncbi:FAD-dependent oxidoreductase [Pseudogemmobacter faecipullorum]|uniref:FAD-dependent oxidoreductase n=1 Tax=Pseudogemmobacter faecipullorum TaxID=2755041 RepID=A0ABS8CMV9_9RHOB|nr:FAD-dependent oxidoreductase [Pseudogemmobacter faecipullorum]MCB5410712.1 FAD-dependent oxidoreductase [Pseudogemmobacter faecipullorum]
MTATAFPHLFSPLKFRNKTARNRIVSTGHDTCLPEHGEITDSYIEYQRRRAKGGVGVIVTQVAGVHETARYTSHLIMASSDECIPGYQRLAAACQAEGALVFSQLFHPGREIMESANGMLAVAYSASASPNERFRMMPRAMDLALLREIVQGYAGAARRMWQAGMDGVELVGSHGYLPAQFLNPRLNQRQDAYGGSLENRLRFTREVLAAMRAATDEDFVIGLRLSAGERDENGLTEPEALEAAKLLDGAIDYLSLCVGTSVSYGGAVHIAAPMALPAAYTAPLAAAYTRALGVPVIITGRINQPQEAEAILARGEADACGMTRAMICDPEMPGKAKEGRFDDIRACIGCNQACIHHFHRGLPISCIQHPESGRETVFKPVEKVGAPKKVMVIGGGPAGMKAASVAAARGHQVTLFEASGRLGGQANLAQLVPGRSEFGGIVTNLTRECELTGVEIRKNTSVDRAVIEDFAPDAVVLATGAVPYVPPMETDDQIQVVTAWQVLRREVKVGARVVVFDWRADWIGPGIAELLAREGSRVDLAINALHVGESLPYYVRDPIAGNLHKLGVSITPYARLVGCFGDSAFFQHTASGEAMEFEGVDTLVLAAGHSPFDPLRAELEEMGLSYQAVGDCLTARTAEEAVYEGMLAGRAV